MSGRGSAGGGGIQTQSLPELAGTAKQVNWANDIRGDFIRNISEAEALLRWWEKNSPEQEETVARLRANADEGKNGASGEYNRFNGNVSAMAVTIGERIRSLNTMVHEEGRSPSRLSASGEKSRKMQQKRLSMPQNRMRGRSKAQASGSINESIPKREKSTHQAKRYCGTMAAK